MSCGGQDHGGQGERVLQMDGSSGSWKTSAPISSVALRIAELEHKTHGVFMLFLTWFVCSGETSPPKKVLQVLHFSWVGQGDIVVFQVLCHAVPPLPHAIHFHAPCYPQWEEEGALFLLGLKRQIQRRSDPPVLPVSVYRGRHVGATSHRARRIAGVHGKAFSPKELRTVS